jgi:hypothetical protein
MFVGNFNQVTDTRRPHLTLRRVHHWLLPDTRLVLCSQFFRAGIRSKDTERVPACLSSFNINPKSVTLCLQRSPLIIRFPAASLRSSPFGCPGLPSRCPRRLRRSAAAPSWPAPLQDVPAPSRPPLCSFWPSRRRARRPAAPHAFAAHSRGGGALQPLSPRTILTFSPFSS